MDKSTDATPGYNLAKNVYTWIVANAKTAAFPGGFDDLYAGGTNSLLIPKPSKDIDYVGDACILYWSNNMSTNTRLGQAHAGDGVHQRSRPF